MPNVAIDSSCSFIEIDFGMILPSSINIWITKNSYQLIVPPFKEKMIILISIKLNKIPIKGAACRRTKTGKRKATDDRVESKVVATTEGRPAGGFDNRRMRTSSDMRWTRARNNYESLLDRPCRNHGDRPANHTVRQCNLGRPRPPIHSYHHQQAHLRNL